MFLFCFVYWDSFLNLKKTVMTIQSMVGSLINICHALSKPSLVFGWEKSKMSVDIV